MNALNHYSHYLLSTFQFVSTITDMELQKANNLFANL